MILSLVLITSVLGLILASVATADRVGYGGRGENPAARGAAPAVIVICTVTYSTDHG